MKQSSILTFALLVGLTFPPEDAGAAPVSEFTARLSGNGYAPAQVLAFGGTGFQPVAADYLGLCHANAAVYETAGGNWRALLSADSAATASLENFGGPNLIPLAGDFDGDEKSDPALYQPASSTWFVKLSTDDYTIGVLTAGCGPGSAGPAPKK